MTLHPDPAWEKTREKGEGGGKVRNSQPLLGPHPTRVRGRCRGEGGGHRPARLGGALPSFPALHFAGGRGPQTGGGEGAGLRWQSLDWALALDASCSQENTWGSVGWGRKDSLLFWKQIKRGFGNEAP